MLLVFCYELVMLIIVEGFGTIIKKFFTSFYVLYCYIKSFIFNTILLICNFPKVVILKKIFGRLDKLIKYS